MPAVNRKRKMVRMMLNPFPESRCCAVRYVRSNSMGMENAKWSGVKSISMTYAME